MATATAAEPRTTVRLRYATIDPVISNDTLMTVAALYNVHTVTSLAPNAEDLKIDAASSCSLTTTARLDDSDGRCRGWRGVIGDFRMSGLMRHERRHDRRNKSDRNKSAASCFSVRHLRLPGRGTLASEPVPEARTCTLRVGGGLVTDTTVGESLTISGANLAGWSLCLRRTEVPLPLPGVIGPWRLQILLHESRQQPVRRYSLQLPGRASGPPASICAEASRRQSQGAR